MATPDALGEFVVLGLCADAANPRNPATGEPGLNLPDPSGAGAHDLCVRGATPRATSASTPLPTTSDPELSETAVGVVCVPGTADAAGPGRPYSSTGSSIWKKFSTTFPPTGK